MADSKKIRDVLNRHLDIKTVQEALDRCKLEGVEADLWSVYFVARAAGRSLISTSQPVTEVNLEELAQTFLLLHESKVKALATLDKLRDMNNAGTRIDWRSDEALAEHGWELSLAQELADYATGISEAWKIINKL